MSRKGRVAWISVLVVLIAAFTLTYLRPREDTIQGEAMGTDWVVRLGKPVGRSRHAHLTQIVTAAIDDVDQKMSTYKDTSEVSRFNAFNSVEPFSVSRDTAHVVEVSLEVSALSEWALDVTVAPLVRAWGFGAGAVPGPPPEHLEAMMALTGPGMVASVEGPALVKKDPRVQIDLSAVAKGYAVDRVAEALEAEGVDRYLVEIGGEVRVLGANRRGQAWSVGVEKPDPRIRGSVSTAFPLTSGAIATSGSYRNFYERDGKRISHTIDPRTGRPVEHNLVSVTVFQDDCTHADAWATAMMVLGPVDGLALATDLEMGVLFMVVEEDGTIRRFTSPALDMDVHG